MPKTILDLFNEYDKGHKKLLIKKENLMRDEKKNKEKIKKINEKIMQFQLRYLNLWTGDLSKNKEDNNEQS